MDQARGIRQVVWASPLPPVRSGVSDYSVELLPHLNRRLPTSVVLPPDVGELPAELAKAGIESFDGHESSGAIRVIHLGNNPYHEWLLPLLDHSRTVVVLHDLVLHHLLVEATLAHGDQASYREQLTIAHGQAGERLAEARCIGVTGPRDPFLFPAVGLALQRCCGVVVHSAWAVRRVRDAGFTGPVLHLPMGVADPGTIDRQGVRRQLGLRDGSFAVMHVGFLTPQKGLDVVLSAVAGAREAGVDAVLVVVGTSTGTMSTVRSAQRLGLGDAVMSTGWVPTEQFLSVPAAGDLGVVLRTPSAGETSAAVLRFLACGTPVMVSARAQFLEVDAGAGPRVTPGSSAAAETARWIVRLARRPQELEQRRQAARRQFERQHRLGAAAERLARWLAKLRWQ